MPDGVIETVETMGQRDAQPIIGHGAPLFEWAPGIAIEDHLNDQVPLDIPEEGEDQGAHEGAHVLDGYEGADEALLVYDPNDDQGADEVPDDYVPDDEPDFEEDGPEDDGDYDHDNPPDEDEGVNEIPTDSEETNMEDDDVGHESHGTEAEFDEEDIEVETVDNEEELFTVPGRYNLRANRERNYGETVDHSMDSAANGKSYDVQFVQHHDGPTPDAIPRATGAPHAASSGHTLCEAVQEMNETGSMGNVMKSITGIVMMQMSAKAGIRKHGQVAIDALFKEFSQLHDLGVFEPQDAKKLTSAEKREALRAISVIKEKRCGKIKGRTVADGRKQKNLYTKEETSSPTVSTDALMMSITIDAMEHRDVATADVAGAYLKADMEDFTLLRMEGESVDIMCDVNKEYRST